MSIADTSQTDYAGQVFKNLPLNRETMAAQEFYECVFEACSWGEASLPFFLTLNQMGVFHFSWRK